MDGISVNAFQLTVVLSGLCLLNIVSILDTRAYCPVEPYILSI
uniref:Uncharacterized protein n=1 Tax=Arundo donax TaxID=35708 RepID=A0A0A8ZQB1_ARUDO